MHVARFEERVSGVESLADEDEKRGSHGGGVRKKEAQLGRERLMYVLGAFRAVGIE